MNEYVNKVIVNGQTLVDLTQDTVVGNVLKQGYTSHLSSGAPVIGTYTVADDKDEIEQIIKDYLENSILIIDGGDSTD